MSRRKGEDFTDVELEIMKILWERGSCSSDDIRTGMPGEEKRKDSTVRTLLGIMERKGYVAHETVGRTFVYRPLVGQETAQRKTVQRVLDRVFDGSPKLLLQCLFDSTDLNERDVREIKRMLSDSTEGK